MSFGPKVGITFRELMSGFVAPGAKTPEQGASSWVGRKSNFSFDLAVHIPELRSFLNGGVHQAEVRGGVVEWTGYAAKRTPIQGGGSIVMYRNVSADGRRKAFDFNFSFKGSNGEFFTVTGEKRIFDNSGLDAGADLSTLYVNIAQDGPPMAAGITRVHVDELLRQMATLAVTGTSDEGEKFAARAAFLTFMNQQLSQVYEGLPFLFRLDPSRYLEPGEWRALSLLMTVMLPRNLPPNGPSIRDTAANLENFVRHADPTALEQIRSALRLVGAVAPLAGGAVNEIRKVMREILEGRLHPNLRSTAELVHRMAVLPYFSHPKADPLVGYKRPQLRPSRNTRIDVRNQPGARKYDVIVIGAGVAGSLVAERLSTVGKRVLVLEAGDYVAERDMTSDELVMTARLYKSSGLQIVNPDGVAAEETGSFPVLQGYCVGGGGAVNNAICFQLPEARLKGWHRLGFPIEGPALRAAYAAVAQDLGIKPASAAVSDPAQLNPVGQFLKAFGPSKKPAVSEPPDQGLYECLVNLAGCEGLGLCNTGCGAERKQNALQVYLPSASERGCEIVAGANVIDFKLAPGGARVESLIANIGGQRRELFADEFIVCAGAVASSALLLSAPDLRRKLEDQGIPVGKRFSANVGSPLFARFDSVLHHAPSLQISHYYLPPSGRGFIIESWYAPPGTIATAMPGYFEEHWQRTLDYAKTVTAAPLVGTAANGRVSIDKKGRTRIELPIGAEDLASLREGTELLAQAFLDAGDVRLVEVIAGTSLGFSIRSKNDIQRYREHVKSPKQLRLGTGHPQGGNAMSTDPSISVVDEKFRVRPFDNLRLCDASVFPETAGVNPQWTVMAIAHECARLLARA
jgi:choline dehydrogenase-like flavoprotein